MDSKALYNISYGMYVICSKKGENINGQIANVLFQVTSDPMQVAVSINKKNLTHDYIEQSRCFTASILSENTPMKFIGNFGFKSGRDFDKFSGVRYKLGRNKIPIVLDNTVAYIEAEVLNKIDAKTHTLFIGKIVDAEVLNENKPMTYEYYQRVKGGYSPKTAPTYTSMADKKRKTMDMEKYVCRICGYVYDPEKGDPDNGVVPGTSFKDLPDEWVCPICGAGKEEFEKKLGGNEMKAVEIKPDIFWVGSIDWDRRLFDELIPLPDGTSYNSYIVKGDERTALIDTVDPSKTSELIDRLRKIKADVDFVVAHHAEQDHSGSIPAVLKLYPKAKVVCTSKCKTILIDLLHIPENKFIEVEDRETLSLGDKTLEFIHAPWVHWPETMFTYLKEEKVLFTCDFLGSHLATSNLFVEDENIVYEAAKRYYAEIMMPFRVAIRKNLEKIEKLDVSIVAPSHGPIYNNPDFIINAYKDWVSDETKNEVVIVYVSMHGSTKAMVDHLIDAFIQRKIKVRPFNLSVTDIGELAMALVDAATVVIASPTVLGGPHPLAIYAAYLVNALRPKTRFVSVVGSYSWGGRMVEQLRDIIKNLKVELLEPVLIKGYPEEKDFKLLDKLAEDIERKHNEITKK